MSDQLIPQSVLLNNLSTIKSIADAVRGTFGPKGLDVMMIDQYGDFTITNDGVQILSLIETSHPAAKILIDAAKTQEEQVGDGTTTVTLLTEALLSEAVKQVEKGVPIPKLIEGIKVALKKTEEDLKEISIPIQDLNDSKLASVALISGRGEKELVDLILQAAKTIGCEKLKNPNFKFAKTIISKSQTESQLIKGIILNKSRLNSSMPFELKAAKVLVIDDALAPEDLPQEAIGTEKGFAQFQQIQANFLQGIKKIIDLGVKLVLVDSNIHPYAEELFVEAGIIAVQRIASSEIQRAIQYTGAKPISRRGLNLAEADLKNHLGFIDSVKEDVSLGVIRLENSKLEGMTTLIISAATESAATEKQRIGSDIASSIQAALRGGVVAGGGAVELALAARLELFKKEQIDSLSFNSYGIDSLIEALKKPIAQISLNAGLNPLEKVAQVISAGQKALQTGSIHEAISLGINYENGEIVSMIDSGIIDPTLVKIAALRTACEVTIQILKVSVIIKSKQI